MILYNKKKITNEEDEFSSIVEASIYIGKERDKTNYNTIQKKIQDVCKGRRKKAYGYNWVYIDDIKVI